MNKKQTRFFLMALSVISLLACNSDYSYKPRGYFKIDFPPHSYQVFDEPGYPYTFEYPDYSVITKDSTFFQDAAENPWWINIDFPRFAGRIYLSYKNVGSSHFDTLVNDAFELAYKQHTYKASSIEPVPFTTRNGIEGIYFTLTGNTATANQFFLTDTMKHFLRGSLYFGATPNEDSLAVVNDFIRVDMEHLINTLKWK